MTKITIVTGPLAGHGGEESVLRTLVSNLSDDYEISLIISEATDELSWTSSIQSSAKIVVIKQKRTRVFKALNVIRAIRREQSDIIIALTPRMVALSRAAEIIAMKKSKVISWMHFSLAQKFSARTAKLLKLADYHLVLNEDMKSQISLLGIPTENIFLVWNPVPRQRRTISGNEGQARFIAVSRIQFSGQKNMQEMVRALAKVEGNWHLDIFGKDDSDNGEEQRKLERLIASFGLENKITFEGYFQDVWSQIDTANAFIMTSTFEGFGMALCEAISFGVPVISSDCPVGPPEIVRDENGFLYPVGDVDKLKELIQQFVNRNVQFDSGKVKQSIQDLYTDRYIDRFKRIIEDLVD